MAKEIVIRKETQSNDGMAANGTGTAAVIFLDHEEHQWRLVSVQRTIPPILWEQCSLCLVIRKYHEGRTDYTYIQATEDIYAINQAAKKRRT